MNLESILEISFYFYVDEKKNPMKIFSYKVLEMFWLKVLLQNSGVEYLCFGSLQETTYN